jgi:hypothetical protein
LKMECTQELSFRVSDRHATRLFRRLRKLMLVLTEQAKKSVMTL